MRTQGPPNIILILADDLGVEGVRAYGGEYHTPNIDRLAREGMRFENAHATPLCSPSRTRILTGQENWRNYEAFSYLSPGQRTFANVLKETGYATAMVGKWQLAGNRNDGRTGITPAAAGFDETHLWAFQAKSPPGSRYWESTRGVDGKKVVHENGFGPDHDARFALDFVDRHRNKPFLLYYSMVLVHNPFVDTPYSRKVARPKDRFAAMVSYMDKQVGDLMAQLRINGLDRNTIVIFTADNGTNSKITTMRYGRPVRGGKGAPTVSGTHVPLIAWGPGRVPGGQVSKSLFDFTDFLPTFAAIAGVPNRAGTVDGVNQWPVIQGKAPAARQSIFMHYAPAMMYEPARFIFDADWKLYGDGRFVSIDTVAGTETDLPVGKLSGPAAARYVAFKKELSQIGDGPLDPTRYPWCRNKPSLDPKQPATIAGCESQGEKED